MGRDREPLTDRRREAVRQRAVRLAADVLDMLPVQVIGVLSRRKRVVATRHEATHHVQVEGGRTTVVGEPDLF